MDIECILRRDGGTRAEIGGKHYHFAPLEDGAHVAAVENPDHVDRFLSISEAYRVYRGALKTASGPSDGLPEVKSPVAQVSALLAGSQELPPQFEIGGQTYTQAQIADRACAAAGLTSDEWNELGDDERAAKMEIVLDDMADEAEKPDESDERAKLVEAYKAKFGKAPHHKKSVEAIKAELEA